MVSSNSCKTVLKGNGFQVLVEILSQPDYQITVTVNYTVTAVKKIL